MKTRTILICVLGLTIPAALAGTTIPSVEAPPTSSSPWTYQSDLYVWGQSLSGTTGIGGFTAPMEVRFKDLLKNLNFCMMGAFAVQHDRWGFQTDLMYASLGETLDAGPDGSIRGTMHQFVGNFNVFYEIAATDTMNFDVFAGARVNSMNLELKAVTGSGHKLLDVSGTQTWVDPIIGARFQYELGHDFFFRTVGDVGGFDVASQFTWQAMAGFGYRCNERGSLMLGYRAIGTDYTQGGFTYDVKAYGPIIGYEMKF